MSLIMNIITKYLCNDALFNEYNLENKCKTSKKQGQNKFLWQTNEKLWKHERESRKLHVYTSFIDEWLLRFDSNSVRIHAKKTFIAWNR